MTDSCDEQHRRMELGEELFLQHFGVKGMKWGIRKEEETGEDSSGGESNSGSKKPSKASEKTSTKSSAKQKQPPKPIVKKSPEKKSPTKKTPEKKSSAKKPPSDYQKEATKPKKTPSSKEVAKNLSENKKKFSDKFGKEEQSSDKGDKQNFVSKHKKLIVGAAVVGGLYLYGSHVHSKKIAEIQSYAGRSIDVNRFNQHVTHSQIQSWGRNNYFDQHSFARPEFSLPPGHTFNRISRHAEDSFQGPTYATHNMEDFNRYVANFRHELGAPAGSLHHVTFQATQEIRVPDLNTALDALRETMHEIDPGATHAQVVARYQRMSGGSWDDPTAARFFEILEQRGYGAIVDEMDAGVIGNSPVVVFAQSMVGDRRNTPLTGEAIEHAENNLIELQNRYV